MSDTDLRELERATQRAPDDGAAWLALAQAAARLGERDRAVEAFYRSAALGGSLPPVREGLRALGAPPTPWGHAHHGDTRRSCCSPLRGPRRGEIVARATLGKGWMTLVIAEDGTVLVGHPAGTLSRFEGRSLAPLSTMRLAPEGSVEPSAGAGIVLARVSGTRPSLFAIEETTGRRIDVPHEHAAESRDAPPALITERAVLVPSPREASSNFVSVHRSDAALGLINTFDIGREGPEVTTDGDRIVFADHEGQGDGRLCIFDMSGALRATIVLEAFPGGPPVIDGRGRILVRAWAGGLPDDPEMPGMDVDCHAVLAFERDGRLAWRVDARGIDDVVADTDLAPSGDGGLWVKSTVELMRVDADGRVTWRDMDFEGAIDLVDREGCLYTHTYSGVENTGVLSAILPDRSLAFRMEGESCRPLAIDAWGRLLALRAERATRELVAIA